MRSPDLDPPAVPVAVALGSNLGDRRRTLDAAVASLREHPALELLAVSDYLANEAVGGPPGQSDYLNATLVATSRLGARDLLELLFALEAEHGRDRRREGPCGARTLDLDLLLFGSAVIDEPDLTVPHPRMLERDFVLGPLSRVAPAWVHPVTGRTIANEADRLAQRHLVRPGLALEGSAP